MLRNWTPREWAAFDRARSWPVPVVAARLKTAASKYMNYDLRPHEATAYIKRICAKEGWPLDVWQFAECAPDHENTLQGEVMRTERYVHLRYVMYGHERMRYTLNTPLERQAEGAAAVAILKQWMDGHSWDTLQYIWDRWPDAIVEFCCYEKPVGLLTTNTLFWEARTHY
jgi:hypothetical protein